MIDADLVFGVLTGLSVALILAYGGWVAWRLLKPVDQGADDLRKGDRS